MFSFLNNIPQVTKNLLILNVLMFLLTLFFDTRGVDLRSILGLYYVNSPLFEPYQMVSHIFMHQDIMHLLLNMFALVMFGGFLERLWGAKRFFVFYIASALGAFLLHNIMGSIELMQLKNQLLANGFSHADLTEVHYYLQGRPSYLLSMHTEGPVNDTFILYQRACLTSAIGASGAVFGILAGFAILFPNTQLMLLFPPIPIKAKYLIGGYFIYEVIRSIYQTEGDSIAHLAHVGGAIVGAILVLIWRRNKTHFY
jgi:membrane associated rhomboid family serine protease